MLAAAAVLCLVAMGSAGGSFGRPDLTRFSARPVQNRFFSQRTSPVIQTLPPVGPISNAQDCVTQPGQWSQCSKPCGGGVRTRVPVVIREATGYGRKCPDLHEESENCNAQPCPVDCVVEPGTYGPCSATCGSGFQTKLDIIIQEAQYGGQACPAEFQLKSSIPCSGLPPCPVPQDCQIGYSEYSQCSQPCGGGIQSRTAFIVQPALNGGAPCPLDLNALTDTKQCNVDIPCQEPKNCEYVEGEFGECDATCGQGQQKAQIYIIAQPEFGGQACPTQLYQTRSCYAGPCPQPMDCVVTYSPFTYCSKQCGGGIQTSQGKIIKQAASGGAPCPNYAQLSVTRTCNNSPCITLAPRDCEIEYGAYSECDKECGGGFRYQKGFIKKEPELGGLACPAPNQLINREACNTFPCAQPKDCKVERGYWSDCNKKCGGGTQSRTVTVVEYAANGGLPCPSNTIDTRTCNTQPCQQIAPPVPTYGRAPAPQAPIFTAPVQRSFVARRVAPRPAAPAVQKTSFTFGGAYGQ